MLKQIMANKAKIASGVLLTGWSALGFYRGVKEYQYCNENYVYRPDSIRYEHWDSNRHAPRNQKDTNEPYLYSNGIDKGAKTIFAGLLGLFTYINPFLGLLMISKELYRLEVCVRGLEDEKKTQKYIRSF